MGASARTRGAYVLWDVRCVLVYVEYVKAHDLSGLDELGSGCVYAIV